MEATTVFFPFMNKDNFWHIFGKGIQVTLLFAVQAATTQT